MECLYIVSVNTRLHRLLVVSLQILGSPGSAGCAAVPATAAVLEEAAAARAGVPGSPWRAGAGQAVQRT